MYLDVYRYYTYNYTCKFQVKRAWQDLWKDFCSLNPLLQIYVLGAVFCYIFNWFLIFLNIFFMMYFCCESLFYSLDYIEFHQGTYINFKETGPSNPRKSGDGNVIAIFGLSDDSTVSRIYGWIKSWFITPSNELNQTPSQNQIPFENEFDQVHSQNQVPSPNQIPSPNQVPSKGFLSYVNDFWSWIKNNIWSIPVSEESASEESPSEASPEAQKDLGVAEIIQSPLLIEAASSSNVAAPSNAASSSIAATSPDAALIEDLEDFAIDAEDSGEATPSNAATIEQASAFAQDNEEFNFAQDLADFALIEVASREEAASSSILAAPSNVASSSIAATSPDAALIEDLEDFAIDAEDSGEATLIEANLGAEKPKKENIKIESPKLESLVQESFKWKAETLENIGEKERKQLEEEREQLEKERVKLQKYLKQGDLILSKEMKQVFFELDKKFKDN